MDFKVRLEEANQSLELLNIRKRGKGTGRLSIRGIFPPKPNDGDASKHYEHATGKPATPAGLKIAKAIAMEMESLLVQSKFEWRPYLKGKQRLPETVGDWVERYVAAHWEDTPETLDKKGTFRKDYVLYFEKLPQNEPLSVELLEQVILANSTPGSRGRKGYAMPYWKLAEFAGLPNDTLKKLGQGYNSDQVNPRNLPSDETLAQAWEKITDPGWRWIFEAMAIYGIRPHEAFRAKVDGLKNEIPVLEVPDDTKTGWHMAFPMRCDNWPFDALEPKLPDVKLEGLTNRQIGMKVAPRFKRWELSFVPYDVRHAYARRGYEFGFPPEFLARSMGHSYAVHCRVYKAWIGQDADLKLYRTVMGIKPSARQAESTGHDQSL